MNNEDKILEMLGTLVDKVSNLETGQANIETKISSMESDIAQIKEDTAITREATNTIVEWIDEASGVVEVRFPVKRK